MNFGGSWGKIAATAVVASGLGYSSVASASTILAYTQVTGGDTITATDDGITTTITSTAPNIPVIIGTYIGGGAPFDAVFNLNLVSSGVITNTLGNLTEAFSGSASWTDGGTTDYLTATFDDTLFAINGSAAASVNAGEPPGSIVYTSNVVNPATLIDPKGLSFSFADVTPLVHIDGTTLAGFVSSVSGDLSANVVPEPMSITVLGIGLLGLGVVRRKRNASSGN
jgi:hypothetical protein